MIDLPVGRTPPNQERAFLHKKLLGGLSKLTGIASGFLPGPLAGVARTVSGITGSFAGQGRGGGFVPRTELGRGITLISQQEKQLVGRAKFPEIMPLSIGARGNGEGGCADPRLVMAPDGHCVAPGSGHFRSHFGGTSGVEVVPVGDAVMGRYGAGLRPGSMVIDRAVCLKGMQLGDDGLCYNKSQISNKQRMWPAGRKPLLSGGDMRAIAIAARAGRRLEGATKRLQSLGMMKKPTVRRVRGSAHEQLLTAHATK